MSQGVGAERETKGGRPAPHPPPPAPPGALLFSSRFRISSHDDWGAPRIHRDGPQEVGRSGWTPTAWCPAYRSPDQPGGTGHVITPSWGCVCPCVHVSMCPVCVCVSCMCVSACPVCVCACVTSRGTCACPRSLGSRRPSELTPGVDFALPLPAGKAAPRPRAASASLPRTSTTWGWGLQILGYNCVSSWPRPRPGCRPRSPGEAEPAA